MGTTRRGFFEDVGRGMLVAGVGTSVALDMGLTTAWADQGAEPLKFGKLEPLVDMMQSTPLKELQPKLVEKIRAGTSLKRLTAAAALANARAFGGHDYVGYHSMMAMVPALQMAEQLPSSRRALPVLKVLYRNTAQIHQRGGRKSEVMGTTVVADAKRSSAGELLRKATEDHDLERAEKIFASIKDSPAKQKYNDILLANEEDTNVHRIVLAHRSWSMVALVGKQHAHTLLRQAMRFRLKGERRGQQPELRSLLPKLFDQHRLAERARGTKRAEDRWLQKFSQLLMSGNRSRAADATAAALAEGIAPSDVGLAISLAANQQVLRDPGRVKARPGKPVGSVHGDSVGVHCSDAVNAWRNVVEVASWRNAAASLIVAAYHTAQRGPFKKHPFPLPEHLESVAQIKDSKALLSEVDSAIRGKDQFRAMAAVHQYGKQGHAARPVFDLLLKYAVSEDGALHAEKYYHTVAEEFAAARPAFRWRQLVALARVTASEYGRPAAGHAQARDLLKLS